MLGNDNLGIENVFLLRICKNLDIKNVILLCIFSSSLLSNNAMLSL